MLAIRRFLGVIVILFLVWTFLFPTQADESKGSLDAKKSSLDVATIIGRFGGSGRPRAISIDPRENAAYPIAICDDSNNLHVFFGKPGKWKRFTIPLQTKHHPRILLSDLNRDAKCEVLVSCENLQIFTISDQGLALVWTSTETFSVDSAPQLGVADFDGDDQLEIVVLNYRGKKLSEGESLYIYERKPGAAMEYTVVDTESFTDGHGYHSTGAMAIGNFYGDARPEIVTGNDNGHFWLLELGNDQLTVVKNWQVPSGGAIGPALAAGNLDSDDHKELLVGTNGGDIFVVEFSTEGAPTFAASAHAGRLAYGIAAGDLNNDGRDEFVLTRGLLGYAGMTESDVVAEVWQFKENKLGRVWMQRTIDCPRPLLREGTGELIVYSLTDKQIFSRVHTPQWNE